MREFRKNSFITNVVEVTNMKHEFGEGLIFTVSNYTLCFLAGDLYFLILNIPLVFVLFILRASTIDNFGGVVFISTLLIAPAFCALLSVMGKFIREKGVYITKDFFKAYKRNFIQAFFLGTLESVSLLIIYIDVFTNKYVYKTPITSFIFLLVIFIVLSIGMFAFPIISRFYLPMKDVIRLSIKYMIKKPKVTMANNIILLAIALFFYSIPAITILFFASGTCFLIMDNEKEILKEIEEMYKNKSV